MLAVSVSSYVHLARGLFGKGDVENPRIANAAMGPVFFFVFFCNVLKMMTLIDSFAALWNLPKIGQALGCILNSGYTVVSIKGRVVYATVQW